jgi:hypothetical protein
METNWLPNSNTRDFNISLKLWLEGNRLDIIGNQNGTDEAGNAEMNEGDLSPAVSNAIANKNSFNRIDAERFNDHFSSGHDPILE